MKEIGKYRFDFKHKEVKVEEHCDAVYHCGHLPTFRKNKRYKVQVQIKKKLLIPEDVILYYVVLRAPKLQISVRKSSTIHSPDILELAVSTVIRKS